MNTDFHVSDLWEPFWTLVNFLMNIIKSCNETKSQNARMDKANSQRQKSFYKFSSGPISAADSMAWRRRERAWIYSVNGLKIL